ncbi:MAG: hypothetical protein HQ549_00350 [Candidatus Omnitrophica bacterium]|nr:hypothetical protein [Candidatus Omnitrophota bacterium]
MLEITNIPIEQTTAVTDAVLALVAAACLFYLRRTKQRDMQRTNIWSWFFGLVTFSSASGALLHGLKMSEALENILWQPLFLALGFVVVLFILGAIYDMLGRAAVRRMLPVMLAIGVAFYAVNLLFPRTFLVFIIYEAITMTFVLIAYSWLALRKRLGGAGLIAIGVLFTIIAAIFQANKDIAARLIWKFDNNGIFHLIQIVGMLFLVVGLREGMGRGKARS